MNRATHTEHKTEASTHAHAPAKVHDAEHRLEERLDEAREVVNVKLHQWPVTTVAAIGGLGLAAAAFIGVGEIAVAGAAGYAAYRWLRGDRAAKRAA